MEVQNALKDKVISSICAMDVRMLDTLLPENVRYEDTYKEVWIAKLITFFKTCKMNGDKTLTVRHKPCEVENWRAHVPMIWIFEAEQTRKRFSYILRWMGIK